MLKLIKERHSVRQYKDKPIEEEKRKVLNDLIAEINNASGLNIQACFDEKEAFDTFMARYGKFENVKNYIVLIGKKGQDEQIGYFGEKLVLKVQELGMNSCWVALTYGKKKTKVSVNTGEKIYCTLAIGYGKHRGVVHKTKTLQQVSNASEQTPEWFINGVECALLAPTAMNQQKFRFVFDNGKVKAKAGTGFYTKVDLGIAKYHFEIGANTEIDWE